MEEHTQFYRKNFSLVVAFLILISVSLVVALGLAYNLTQKYVENEFASQKIDVLEQTVAPYNNLFQNKIPEISYYQGFLDSASVHKYTDTVLFRFPFVSRIVFYDAEISNHKISDGFRVNNFSMGPKAVYQYGKHIPADSVVLFKNQYPHSLSLKTADEFNKMAVKFAGFIESVDTTKTLSVDDIFNVFYSINSGRITYMNIPRPEEMRVFKDMMFKKLPPSPVYEQDIMTFYLDPFKLKINNPHPELYQYIQIKPLVYESLENDSETISTDIPLPGAFSGFKLYFSSPKSYLTQEINRRFFPIALSLLLIYGVLVLIAYLIFRNLNINSKMFKLQYDFINNLTHEFKTPVSVIKIAGNNIRSASQLSDRERTHYGKILDEEADKLNDLMNKLLSFTQIENKAIQVKEELINLEVFCQNIIDSYQLKYPHFNITCQIDRLQYFKSDPVLLGSIFQNLIDNAYKYSPAEHKVLQIFIRKEKKNIVFRFVDQGIGIPSKEVAHIFKKFYRIQSQYNQQGSVGLGLAFCKELVNFMNGSISVTSREGKGSEFRIELPYESISAT
ncbi:MAG TPA: HAMP domain-containing sensor histidine kinase [Daejeonella sp.]|nr:HAMP domain-containing sensor histidine kinase [Daejeonella sp.]